MRWKCTQTYRYHHLTLLRPKAITSWNKGLSWAALITISSRLGSQSCQPHAKALLFLESVPDPSEQRSVLQTLSSLTCKGEKQDNTTSVSPASTPLFPLAVRSMCGTFWTGSLDSVQAFNAFQWALQQSDVQTFGHVPGAETQLAGQSGGRAVSLRWDEKYKRLDAADTGTKKEEGRRRTKGHKERTSGKKKINPEAHRPLHPSQGSQTNCKCELCLGSVVSYRESDEKMDTIILCGSCAEINPSVARKQTHLINVSLINSQLHLFK